ncbi:hypothetical protein AB4Z10_15125 [Bosea sp. RAF48]|jgi:hypothetical protein|uniref:hypothetical protein n=1 Tax=Bosea sp. RAF48 TaxID=3237480 RepID=UPI003F908A4E
MSMSVSRLRGEIPTIHDPAPEAVLPPFWELEDLLATGLDCDEALAVMAARRAAPRLVDGGGFDESPERQSFLLRFDAAD